LGAEFARLLETTGNICYFQKKSLTADFDGATKKIGDVQLSDK
jgi:hypothetical protein